jgi:hypothetical protein
MSYLTMYATRRSARPGTRVDEKTMLNLPSFHGGAHVRVLVEDTTGRKWRRALPEPKIRLRITDCANAIHLQFELASPEERENSLYKINTLVAALQRFRDALDAEAELYARREQHRPRKEVSHP